MTTNLSCANCGADLHADALGVPETPNARFCCVGCVMEYLERLAEPNDVLVHINIL